MAEAGNPHGSICQSLVDVDISKTKQESFANMASNYLQFFWSRKTVSHPLKKKKERKKKELLAMMLMTTRRQEQFWA